MRKVEALLEPGRAGAPAMRLAAMLSRLNLTDDQKEKVAKIQEETKAAVEKADGPQAKAEAVRAALEKIKKDILTDEQRKALAELEKAGPAAGEGLPPMLAALKGLTDEQKAKIKDIWAEALKNAASADNKRQVMREALDKIAEQVLTADQKEELKKAMGPGAAGARAGARQKTQD
jgi:chromosome segregation ATPase